MKRSLAISMLLPLLGSGCIQTRSVSSTASLPTPPPPERPIISKAPDVQRMDLDSTEKNLARILPQPPKRDLIVALARIEKQGFIIISNDENGKPGKTLGTSGLLFAGENTQVAIRMTTATGTTYWASLVLDNGDQVFSPKQDPLANDHSGRVVQFKFTID